MILHAVLHFMQKNVARLAAPIVVADADFVAIQRTALIVPAAALFARKGYITKMRISGMQIGME